MIAREQLVEEGEIDDGEEISLADVHECLAYCRGLLEGGRISQNLGPDMVQQFGWKRRD